MYYVAHYSYFLIELVVGHRSQTAEQRPEVSVDDSGEDGQIPRPGRARSLEHKLTHAEHAQLRPPLNGLIHRLQLVVGGDGLEPGFDHAVALTIRAQRRAQQRP